MENKYYLFDPESGFKYEVTKEHYDKFRESYQIVIPELKQKIGVPIICGTGGEIINQEEYKQFFSQYKK